MAWETLLVDGTGLESVPGVSIADWSGVLASGAQDSESFEAPMVRGAVGFVAGELKPYSFDVPLIVTGADVSAVHSSLSALRALFWGTVTLTRRVSYTGPVNRSQTARAVLAGFSVQMDGTTAARVSLALMNVDGCWYEASPVAASASGTLTVPGDTPTPNATLTLASGASIALPGSSLSYSGTGTLVLDGLTWEASSGQPGGVTHAGSAYPLLFMPGDNTLTITGTASVSVYGAWR